MSQREQHVEGPADESRAGKKRRQLRSVFRSAALVGALGNTTVAQVMTLNPITVSPETSAGDLVQLFQEKRFRHFLVAENDILLGVVSDRDVIRLFGMDDSPERPTLERFTAGELMSDKIVTVGAETPLVDAVRFLVDRGINCLPVTDTGKPIGILTGTDIYLALEQLLLAVPAAQRVSTATVE